MVTHFYSSVTYKSKSKKENVIVVVLLATSVIVTNSFVIFLPNEVSRFYVSGLISTAAVGVALVISIIAVWRYKRGIKKRREQATSTLTTRLRYEASSLLL
jgi:membrane protein implicated in regulation of membrane protease activity